MNALCISCEGEKKLGNHADFLNTVAKYVEMNPDVAAHIADFVQLGLKRALDKSKTRAATFETLFVAAMNKKSKGNTGLILSKLKELQGNTAYDYSSLISELEDQLNATK